VARLRQNALLLETFRPDLIRGHITLDRSRLLVFSIPFDRGWQVSVDGRPAALLKVNVGFMGVMMSPGRHAVSLQYRPPLLLPGLALSGGGLLICLALIVRGRRRVAHGQPAA
jgi:uncharacterized membrane protein YfhO